MCIVVIILSIIILMMIGTMIFDPNKFCNECSLRKQVVRNSRRVFKNYVCCIDSDNGVKYPIVSFKLDIKKNLNNRDNSTINGMYDTIIEPKYSINGIYTFLINNDTYGTYETSYTDNPKSFKYVLYDDRYFSLKKLEYENMFYHKYFIVEMDKIFYCELKRYEIEIKENGLTIEKWTLSNPELPHDMTYNREEFKNKVYRNIKKIFD